LTPFVETLFVAPHDAKVFACFQEFENNLKSEAQKINSDHPGWPHLKYTDILNSVST
jgi:hypothetical protein